MDNFSSDNICDHPRGDTNKLNGQQLWKLFNIIIVFSADYIIGPQTVNNIVCVQMECLSAPQNKDEIFNKTNL